MTKASVCYQKLGKQIVENDGDYIIDQYKRFLQTKSLFELQ